MSLPPLVPVADPGAGVPLEEQVWRLGDAGFPLVLVRGEGLDPEALWPGLQAALRRSREEGGWPFVGMAGPGTLAQRAADSGWPLWNPEPASLERAEGGPEAMERRFESGAEALVWLDGVPSGDALWQAQALRWSARPPIRKGQGVALVGGSGCGKSTLARKLGRHLGLPVLDVDEAVAREAGKAIPRIFAEDGEPAFRRLEAEATCRAFQSTAVFALGGGAWESEAIRVAAREADVAVLWIAERPGRVWDRIARDPGRPLAQDRQVFLERWRARMERWREADMVLPLGRSAGHLARALAASLP